MATVNDKIKKILAMIDGATTEGEARAASLALQRLLVANDMTLDEISLSDDAPEINETGEDVGKRVAIWVKALAYVIASNYRCESYFHVRHERDFWTNRQKITSKQVVFVVKTEPKQHYIVSQDTSIHDAGAEDGYGYGKGDRIAEVA